MEKKCVFSFIGWSGSGKTTFVEKLIVCLKGRGIRVAVIKEAPKAFELDEKGKDTWRFSQAGADQVIIANPKAAVQFINRSIPVQELVEGIHDADLILIEGHRDLGYPQLEVYREEVSKGLRCPCIADLRAVITDDPLELPDDVRRFGLSDVDGVADYLLMYKS